MKQADQLLLAKWLIQRGDDHLAKAQALPRTKATFNERLQLGDRSTFCFQLAKEVLSEEWAAQFLDVGRPSPQRSREARE